MSRPTMSETLLEIAQTVAKRGTCDRLQVGAVLADSRGVVLSTGYNGSLAGTPHCDHECTCSTRAVIPPEPHLTSCLAASACRISVHAEANAILWAARRGVATEDSRLYVTHSPCIECAKLIVQAGIAYVEYRTPYRADNSGLSVLTAGHVPYVGVERHADDFQPFNPSAYGAKYVKMGRAS